MINRFLQSLKITRLAIALARFDALSALDFPGIKKACFPARFFAGGAECRKGGINSFLEKYDSPFLRSFFSSLLWRQPDILSAVACPHPESPVSENKNFYISLFRQLVKYSPELRPAYKTFMQQLDFLSDRRLYAGELEYLADKESGFDKKLSWEIDWINQSKEKLCLTFPDKTVFSDSLGKKSQQTLAGLWGYLFFEKSVLIPGWASIASDKKNNVNFYYPDAVFPADSRLQNYAVAALTENRLPKSYAEFLFQKGLFRLRRFCPDVDFNKSWREYLQVSYREQTPQEPSEAYLKSLSNTDFAAGFTPPVPLTPLSRFAELSKPKKLTKDRRFANSSPLVAVGLALLIFLLLKYF